MERERDLLFVVTVVIELQFKLRAASTRSAGKCHHRNADVRCAPVLDLLFSIK